MIKKIEQNFVPKMNIVFECGRFNQRKQQEGESAESFIANIHALSSWCEYGVLCDDLFRDRIVVGIRDQKLSAALQLDEYLTLEKIINKVMQCELVSSQQPTVRPQDDVTVSCVSSETTSSQHSTLRTKENATISYKKQNQSESSSAGTPIGDLHMDSSAKCRYCGYRRHCRDMRPARRASCHSCSLVGHYAR